MKRDITSGVTQCTKCGAYFLLGIEGEGDLCDLCVAPEAPPLDSFEDAPALDAELVD